MKKNAIMLTLCLISAFCGSCSGRSSATSQSKSQAIVVEDYPDISDISPVLIGTAKLDNDKLQFNQVSENHQFVFNEDKINYAKTVEEMGDYIFGLFVEAGCKATKISSGKYHYFYCVEVEGVPVFYAYVNAGMGRTVKNYSFILRNNNDGKLLTYDVGKCYHYFTIENNKILYRSRVYADDMASYSAGDSFEVPLYRHSGSNLFCPWQN